MHSIMPPRYNLPRDSGGVLARWLLGLVVVGLAVLYWLYPIFSQPDYEAPSSSPVFAQLPGMRASWYDAAAPDIELSANPGQQTLVDGYSRRHIAATPALNADIIADKISSGRRARKGITKNTVDDKSIATRADRCRMRVVEIEWETDCTASELVKPVKPNKGGPPPGHADVHEEGYDDDFENYYEENYGYDYVDSNSPFKNDKERIKNQVWGRSPLRWTQHRGPPNHHNSPRSGPVKSLDSVSSTPRVDNDMKASTEPLAPILTPAEQTTGADHQSEKLRSWQRKCRPYNPRIVRLPFGCGKPERNLRSGSPEKRRGNSNAIPRPEHLPVKQVRPEIISRLGCTCRPYISSIFPCECRKSESVGIEKRLVKSAPENDHHAVDEKGLLAHWESSPYQNQQSQAEPLTMRYPSRSKQSVSGRSICGPSENVRPDWRYCRRDESTRDTRSFDNHPNASSKTVSQIESANLKQNYTKLNLRPTVTGVLISRKCNATTTSGKRQCESTHQATIIFYSLLGVLGISILMLGLLKCVMCFRNRRRAPAPMDMRIRFESKSGNSSRPSLAVDSLASRREEPGFVAQGHATLDGTNDDWRRESGTWWNIFRGGRRAPGRFSPISQARAPRIPTLKLPKPAFITVRKVSGLGFDGLLASYRQVKRGKETDISRLKWTSTV